MRSPDIGRLGRWHWRRLEKRAIVAYQRELVSTLRRLGDEETPVVGLEIVAGHSGTMLGLILPRHRLALAGTAFGACTALCPPGNLGSPAMTLSDAGRYGRAWWLTLTVGGGTVTVLGSHIYLVPDADGHAVRDDGSSPVGCVVGTGSRAG